MIIIIIIIIIITVMLSCCVPKLGLLSNVVVKKSFIPHRTAGDDDAIRSDNYGLDLDLRCP